MEDLRKYTRKSEIYKLSAEEQMEKMKLVMKEVEKISAYTGVSEEVESLSSKVVPAGLLSPAIISRSG